MDLGIGAVPQIIASSTTGYLVQFLPIFALIGGLVLAFVIAELLLGFIQQAGNRQTNTDVFDSTAFNRKADELQEFYSRRGRSGAAYDYKDIDRMI